MSDLIPTSPAPGGEFLFYQSEDGRTRLQVRVQGETVWLSLNQMADLFQRDKSVISKHIRNVFEEGELKPGATVAKFATVQAEGDRTVSREIEFYNLDVIISVGYRVKSQRLWGRPPVCRFWHPPDASSKKRSIARTSSTRSRRLLDLAGQRSAPRCFRPNSVFGLSSICPA